MALDTIGVNMHMDTRVIKVADFKSEVKGPPRLFDVIQHHMPISRSPCRRRSIGPLPSCSPSKREAFFFLISEGEGGILAQSFHLWQKV